MKKHVHKRPLPVDNDGWSGSVEQRTYKFRVWAMFFFGTLRRGAPGRQSMSAARPRVIVLRVESNATIVTPCLVDTAKHPAPATRRGYPIARRTCKRAFHQGRANPHGTVTTMTSGILPHGVPQTRRCTTM